MKIIAKTYNILSFIFFYLLKLIESNLYIAYDILTPKMHVKPGMIEVPITIRSDFGILLFSNLLSMTPGSLSIDISVDKKQMKVHILYNNNEQKSLKEIENIQERIKKIIK
ncbi:MAG: Na+/H+ antiporter subunit E [Bacteroidales bacterium]|nr:Na+/H+ antiporter subunit E [Bacteroidales bacterium]